MTRHSLTQDQTHDQKVLACMPLARELAGLTQAGMAKLAGISRAAVLYAEAGKAKAVVAAAISSVLREKGVSYEVRNGRSLIWLAKSVEMSDDERIGLLMSTGRTAANLTQFELAKAADISQRTVVNVEKGNGALPAVLAALDRALYAHRVKLFEEKDRCCVSILEATAPLRPLAIGASRETRDETLHRVFSDPERPAFTRYHVEIEGAAGRIWRELAVPENLTFEDFHRALRAAFGWRQQQEYVFDVGLLIGSHENLEDAATERNALDGRLAWLYDLSANSCFTYVYGQDVKWIHRIVRGATEAMHDRALRPYVLAGAGAGPIEDCGGIENYNKLAGALRAGRAKEDEIKWLGRQGYGRRFDPNVFNLAICNDALSEIEFDISETWLAQRERRREVTVIAPFLERRAAQAAAPKMATGLRIIAIEEFGEKAFEREGVHGEFNESRLTDWRRDRQVCLRSTGFDVFGRVVFQAPDVLEYRSWPVRVIFENNGKKRTFYPDMEVTLDMGDKLLLHSLSDVDVVDVDIYEKLSEEMRRLGRPICFLGAAARKDPLVVMANVADRYNPKVWPRDAFVEKFLTRLVDQKGLLDLPYVLERMILGGHSYVKVDAPEKDRALMKLVAAATVGVISISMDAADPSYSKVGKRGHFDSTLYLRSFVERSNMFGKDAA